mmetsp:Transcript_15405/g.33300  ORF Transcript_15405/g.33300 Transcript_15405/m.33300 type:complete len:826 (-) Transcript_15405:829-3306(-)
MRDFPTTACDVDYEYALVFQFAVKDKSRTDVLRRCEEVFHSHGLQTHVVPDALSGPKRTVISFLLLHLPLKRKITLAQREQIKVELHNGLFESFCLGRMHEYRHASNPKKLICPTFAHDVILDIIQSATGPKDGIAVMTETDVTDIIQHGRPLVAQLTELNVIVDQFFLHPECAKEMVSTWILNIPLSRPWEQPIDEIRTSFGARIALYFAFFGFYTKMLLVPTLLGGALQLYWSCRGSIEWYSASFFACFTTIWAILFLALWKRERNTLVTSWGLLSDEFEMMRRFTKLHNWRRLAKTYKHQSLVASVLLALMLVGVVITFLLEYTTPCMGTPGSLCLRGTDLDRRTRGWASEALVYGHMAAYLAVDALLISVCKFVALRALERDGTFTHRQAQQQDEENLVRSVFNMHFIEYYITLCYYAFWLQDLNRLAAYMAKLMTLKQVASLGLEILPLMVKQTYKHLTRKQAKHNRHLAPPGGTGPTPKPRGEARLAAMVVKQYNLDVYDDPKVDGMFDDYLHLCFQFGYITLFGGVYPLAALYAFANNLLELRTDAFKVLALSRHPRRRKATTLGVWLALFERLATASILFNAGLIYLMLGNALADHGKALPWDPSVVCSHGARFGVVVALKFMVLLIKHFVPKLLPEHSDAVVEHMRRQEAFCIKHRESASGVDHFVAHLIARSAAPPTPPPPAAEPPSSARRLSYDTTATGGGPKPHRSRQPSLTSPLMSPRGGGQHEGASGRVGRGAASSGTVSGASSPVACGTKARANTNHPVLVQPEWNSATAPSAAAVLKGSDLQNMRRRHPLTPPPKAPVSSGLVSHPIEK